ncbi:ABC transporter substrate-binding protein [Selenihalanaerobacter shriftii]|uniref:Peptide/nickel transport system substrate-binding protein n=1 Tax=Selenihalanaerobacter shriftii TaxID=142842 RepID=A0A1T4R2T5_9FIRM|nr:ABC transporter substrate-binding protein [Selenihalanaerobacter shriftii]SKA10330.1 peptide/nickel transport system substrate-binding protein [Selenihalanaerobacter shriftii]
MFNKKSIALVLIIAVVGFALVGCGQSEKAAEQAPEKNQQQTEKKAQEKVKPKSGGTLVFGRGGDSVKLDPADVTDGESMKVTRQMLDGLVEYKPGETEIEPALAKSWETSEDGLTWTFNLRKGVKFHDGTKFNADAVVFNFKRWMNKDHKYHDGQFVYWGYMFGGFPGVVKSVEAVDEYTVKFTLKEKLAPFLANLAMGPFGISSPTAIKKYGEDYFKHPVGTGPFKFVKWVKGDRIILEANEDYWEGRPYLDKVVFRVIPDNTARFMELQSGSIDMIDGVNPNSVPQIRNADKLKLSLRPSMNVGYLAMNFDKKPFGNVKVRRAINHAINKKEIIKGLYAGLGKPAKNPLPPSLWGYNEDIDPYEYNPEKAKKLLAEAGYPDGFKTTLWAMPNPRPYMPQPKLIAQAMQSDLEAIGVKAEIRSYDWGTYLQKTENGEHDMALLGWTGDNGDPDNFLYVLLDKDNAIKGSAGNIAFYKSDPLHELLIKAQTTMDQEKRAELYKKSQKVIHKDAPWVPVAHSNPPLGLKNKVMNYEPSPVGQEKLNDVWLKQ